MAEIATIARPYAEALMKASADGDAAALAAEVTALAQVAADPTMRQFADDPKARSAQVVDVLPQNDFHKQFLATFTAAHAAIAEK